MAVDRSTTTTLRIMARFNTGRGLLKRGIAAVWTRPPLLTGLAATLVLFVLFLFGTLDHLSAHTDTPRSYLGYDFFGLPRCGLALRFGTNPFTSAEEYPQYGWIATPWVTHPSLCLLGVPLSYLPPWTAFWSFTAFNLALHIGIITVFGLRLSSAVFRCQSRLGMVRDLIFFALMGLFVPWYVLYFEGQYHSVAVLALALVLAGAEAHAEWTVAGFVLSALAKPVLAPAGLALVTRRQWRAVAIIAAAVALGTLPWMFLSYDVRHGLSVDRNQEFVYFLRNSRDVMRYSIYRWNQQVSLAAALDEVMSPEQHLRVRYALAGTTVAVGAVLFMRKRFGVAVVATTLWFFFLYGRGHEYHITLYVPMVLYLYTLPDGRYRGWPLVAIALLVALPSTYPLYRLVYGVTNPEGFPLSNETMLSTNRLLYNAFLWQKPLCAFLLLGLLLLKERPYRAVERTHDS